MSLNQRVVTKPLILTSEIQQLNDLKAITKIHQFPYFFSEWKYKKINKINEPFLINESLKIEKR